MAKQHLELVCRFLLSSGAGVYEDYDGEHIYIEQRDGSMLDFNDIDDREFFASLTEEDCQKFWDEWKMTVNIDEYDAWHPKTDEK